MGRAWSEDEWYKAAYHYNDGVTGNYFDWPTRSDIVPACECCPAAVPNSANYDCNGTDHGGLVCGPPFYRTNVGCYDSSASPYATFDQGGNVWEWTQTAAKSARVLRGGSFATGSYGLMADYANEDYFPAKEDAYVGFRVASVGDTIPTVSEWSLVVMAVVTFATGAFLFGKQRRCPGAA